VKKAVSLAIPLALCLFSQTLRDSYRDAYREWRQADPTLEQDASGGGAAFAPRARSAAEKATRYSDARIAFLHELTGGYDQTFSWLEDAQIIDLPSASSKTAGEYLAAGSATVNRNIAIFANDTDKGMQHVQQALERERKALADLSGAYAERQKAVTADKEAAAAAESARLKAVEQVLAVLKSLDQTTEQTTRENARWTEYYRKLGEGATKEISAGSPAPTPLEPAKPIPPDPVPAVRTVPPSSLARYTGAWIYPAANRVYRGPQPEFIDMVIREENGNAVGALFATFKQPRGSWIEPEVQFSFSGEFQNTSNQVFALKTSDGVKGTVELIPGSTPNLLEVKFETEEGLGKIRLANFVLVRK